MKEPRMLNPACRTLASVGRMLGGAVSRRPLNSPPVTYTISTRLLARAHQARAQRGVSGIPQVGVFGDQRVRRGARLRQDVPVAQEVRGPQPHPAVLLPAQQRARSPQLQVLLGELKAVRRLHESVEPGARGLLGGVAGD